ncbi:hypothetical protein PFISCL1PPCAC_13768, partial [Pristionchus fissidentatus]
FQAVNDVLLFLLQTFTIGVWEIIPASGLLQYLALCKPHLSDGRRLLLAYAICAQYYTELLTPESDLLHYEEIARRTYNVSTQEGIVVYGVSLFPTPTNKKNILDLAIFAVIPSFIIASSIFIWCYVQISQALGKFGVKLSTKTRGLQRSFLTMLLMQVS